MTPAPPSSVSNGAGAAGARFTSRSQRRKVTLLAFAGAVFAAMALLIVFNIDREPTRRPQTLVRDDVIELIPPDTMAAGEGATSLHDLSSRPHELGAENTWIRAEKNGKPQLYRFAAHDPNPQGLPAGWSKVIRPEIQMFLADDRVVTLQSDTAVLRSAARTLESGTMTGNVIIRVYRLDAPQTFDPAVAKPVVEARTREASFDNIQGEIRCDGEVDLQTPTAHLPGSRLRVHLNEVEDRIEWLRLEHVDVIRLSQVHEGESSDDASAEDAQLIATQPGHGGDDSGADNFATSGVPPAVDQTQPPSSAETVQAAADGTAAQEQIAAASDSQRERRARRQRRNARRTAATADSDAAQTSSPQFYQLTLKQNVEIHQGDVEHGWEAHGDELHIIFSMESEDLGSSLSRRNAIKDLPPAAVVSNTVAAGATAVLPKHALGMSLVIATTQDAGSGLFQPNDDDIFVTCEGGLTLIPLPTDRLRPATSEDARFELSGTPMHLISHADGAHVHGARLQYQTLAQIVELDGTAEFPLTIDSPQMRGQGERFTLNRLQQTGAFERSGWMIMRERNADQSTPNPAAVGPVDATAADELRIDWSDRVDLVFAKSNAAGSKNASAAADRTSVGPLKSAAFAGDVQVTSPELEMRCDAMTVQLAAAHASPAAEQSAADDLMASGSTRGVESIHASGSVHARSLADEGSLSCQTLDVHFGRSESGTTVPVQMLARREVKAVDAAQQTIWAEALNIAFLSPDELPAHDPELNIEFPPDPPASRSSKARVKSLIATDDVQVLMADGARAFADRLDADAITGNATLTGSDVMIVSQQAVLHHGSRLELYRDSNGALWPGAGQFAYYTQPLGPSAAERMDRPQLQQIDLAANPLQVIAGWTESMTFDGNANGGAGALTIRGSIDSESWPNPLEHSTLSGNVVTMHFMHVLAEEMAHEVPSVIDAGGNLDAAAPDADGPDQQGSASPGAVKRQLRLFIAEGNAKIENRTWLKQDRSDVPRVFYVAGPRVEYDALTLEANVRGAGELLVRDESVPDDAEAAGGGQAAVHDASFNAPFSGRGTSHFRWSDHLQMTRDAGAESLYNIEMIGDISVIHQALDKSVSTITSRELHATVQRTGLAAKSVQEDAQQAEGQPPDQQIAPAAQDSRTTALDLGGAMDLRRLRALGGVLIETPARTIDCEELDYDYTTGIATMTALPGRLVTVMTAGNPNPMRAQRVVWDMVNDKITLTNPRGAAPR